MTAQSQGFITDNKTTEYGPSEKAEHNGAGIQKCLQVGLRHGIRDQGGRTCDMRHGIVGKTEQSNAVDQTGVDRK